MSASLSGLSYLEDLKETETVIRVSETVIRVTEPVTRVIMRQDQGTGRPCSARYNRGHLEITSTRPFSVYPGATTTTQERIIVTPPGEYLRPTLQIAVLGPPIVAWAGVTLPIPRRQARALLYRLAVPLAPVPRTQLCYLFWPDVPDATARRNLTHLLTLLRRALPQPDMLVAEGETVGLHRRQAWSDADAFARLTRTADALARPAALVEALDLCRGPLLDGFALPDCPEFESWLDLERSAWERRFDDALAAVVETHTVAGDYAAAIAAAERYLRRDALAEEMHRRLIALHAAAGNRTAALRQFEQCAIVLERELGVAPLPETRAVYESVRDGSSPLSPPAALARQTMGTTGGMPIPPTPLIGRATVLEEVTALLRNPVLRLLTCSGPGGTGKTRLAL